MVTGSSGFLGQALVQELRARGHEVIGVPRELLYFKSRLQQFVNQAKPGYIYHLASYGNRHYQTEDSKIIGANINATVNLLYASQDAGYKAFVNCGSSSEYGTKRKPMLETDSLDTDTFYGVTKAAATLICRAYAKKYQRPVVTVRPFSVYGDGDSTSKFIPSAIRSFTKGELLKLGPGVHDWIEINDFVKGMVLVAENADKLKGQAVNIGTGVQTSNHGVIALLREMFGKPGNVKQSARMREYDTSVAWVADTTLIRSLGWKPSYSLERGLAKLIYGDDHKQAA